MFPGIWPERKQRDRMGFGPQLVAFINEYRLPLLIAAVVLIAVGIWKRLWVLWALGGAYILLNVVAAKVWGVNPVTGKTS